MDKSEASEWSRDVPCIPGEEDLSDGCALPRRTQPFAAPRHRACGKALSSPSARSSAGPQPESLVALGVSHLVDQPLQQRCHSQRKEKGHHSRILVQPSLFNVKMPPDICCSFLTTSLRFLKYLSSI